MTGLPIAFYAPLKSPRHPAPSGDRTMARLLMKALAAAGFDPHLASEVRTLDKAGDAAVQERIRRGCEQEASRLVDAYRGLPPERRPRLWLTYHVYYKAPDWIGPQVADSLGIPYCIAEGSRAAKRASGAWAMGHRGAEAALDRADAVFVMTAQDREALERARPHRQTLVDLPPFLDTADWPAPPRLHERREPRLLTVAMMRSGDKLASYRILAQAVRELRHRPWTLEVVGDGEARGEVEAMFASLAGRVRFHGLVADMDALRGFYREADLFVWPAVNEAYGMVFLEAQGLGCPVVAGRYGGVPSVVLDGTTGLLTPPGDAGAFAAAVGALLDDPMERRRLGDAAEAFVREERSLSRAAERLRHGLMPLLGPHP